MAKGVRASGSTIRAIAKGPLIGIKELHRSTTKAPPGKPVKAEKPSVAAQTKEVARIYREAAEIVGVVATVEALEAVTVGVVVGIQSPIEAVVIARLVEVSEGEVKRGRRAAEGAPAAEVPEVVLAAAAAEEAAVVVAAEEAVAVAAEAEGAEGKDCLEMTNI